MEIVLLRCFDTVDCEISDISSIQRFFFGRTIGIPGLTWMDLWKMGS